MRSGLVLSLLLLAVAVAGEPLDERMDRLVERWRAGDAAARAGVLAETRALGDEALSILFERLAAREEALLEPGDPGTIVAVEIHVAESPAADEGARILSEEDAAALGEGTPIGSPSLTVYDGQRANVSILEEKEYVRTYDEARAPVKGVVQVGLVLDVRPVVSVDRKAVTLELRCVRSALDGIPEMETPLGRIGVPQVLTRDAALTVTVPAEAATTLALPCVGAGKALLLTLRAQVLDARIEGR
jgi:hypothetical protein